MQTSVIEHRASRAGEPLARTAAALAVMLYLAITLFALNRYPIVGQDEPLIAAPAYKLATEGTLGSDLFAGYRGMERHHFVHMPVYAVIEAFARPASASCRCLPGGRLGAAAVTTPRAVA
jgi:hypothetical protein